MTGQDGVGGKRDARPEHFAVFMKLDPHEDQPRHRRADEAARRRSRFVRTIGQHAARREPAAAEEYGRIDGTEQSVELVLTRNEDFGIRSSCRCETDEEETEGQ